MDLNRAYLIGSVGSEPEWRKTPGGASVCIVHVITRRARKVEIAGASDWEEAADFHRCTAHGKDADHIKRFVQKGAMIALECRIEQSRWTDADGRLHRETGLGIERVLWVNNARVAEPAALEVKP